MGFFSLIRRRTQLEVLAQACEQRAPVRVSLPPWAEAATLAHTRFLALEPDGILLHWPPRGLEQVPVSGATVDLYFEHGRQGLGCRTETRGRAWWLNGGGQVAAWKLALPLRLEAAQQRRHFRVSLLDLTPIPARCTRVAEPDDTFAVLLQNLSAGGLLGRAGGAEGPRLTVGELLWTEFALPGADALFEFVVRVAHVRPARRSNALYFGCMFCPGDDATRQRAQLERIEHFVARRERAQICHQRGEGDDGC